MKTPTRERFRNYTDEAQFARIVEMDTVTEMWNRCLADYADLPAIVDNGLSHSYRELEPDAAGFRTLLAAPASGTRVRSYFVPWYTSERKSIRSSRARSRSGRTE